ncbi:hypothetical protein [Micrococcus luteus]|uniref:hypothetical protein n=1 Tax=Micrococcus luteus TaxID=1270 RepID=UPI0034DB5362
MSDHYADHYPHPEGPERSWGYIAEGPGRWCILEHPLGHEAGLLFVTDADDAVGVLPNGQPNGYALSMDFTAGVQAAYGTGVSSPTVVFDHWADRATMSIAAQPVHHAQDLGAVAEQYGANATTLTTPLES